MNKTFFNLCFPKTVKALRLRDPLRNNLIKTLSGGRIRYFFGVLFFVFQAKYYRNEKEKTNESLFFPTYIPFKQHSKNVRPILYKSEK